jgi:CHAT domain-containing protein/tetratricopeptide (TPR) repeat protein
MYAPLLLALLWLLPPGVPAPVRVADDFRTNTLKDYEVKGDVTWQKGQVTLGKGAQLTRKLALGHTAAVRAVVQLPAATEGAEVVLRFQGEKVTASIALRRQQGKTVLVNLEEPPEEVVLATADGKGQPRGPSWVVYCALRYGVIQAKAWPEGQREPAAWQTTRYSGETVWEPRSVHMAAGKVAGGGVTALEVTGHAPVPPLSPELRQQAERAEVLDREMGTLYGKGKIRDAVAKAREVLAIRQKVFGPEHPATTLSLNNLGYLLKEQGEHAAAWSYLEQALAITKKVLGPEHPRTATSLNNLGLLLQAQAKYAAARSYLEQALAICQKVLGPEHPDTAARLHNLGFLLQAQGEYAAARPYFEQALAIQKKVLGPDHSDTATSLNNLGYLLRAQGEHGAARPYYEQALAILKKVLGPEHPHTAASLSNLGAMLVEQGEYAAARPYYEQALAITKKVRGPEHPDTALVLNNLGGLHWAQGEYAAARPYLEQALTIYQKVPGPEHPDTALILNNLGYLLKAQEDYAAARRYLEQALAIKQKVLGPDHPDTATSLNNLGALLAADNDARGAWRALVAGAASYVRSTDRLLAASAERQHADILRRRRSTFEQLLSLAEAAPQVAAEHRAELLAGVLDWRASSGQALRARYEALLSAQVTGVAPLLDEIRRARQRLVHALLRGPGRRPGQEYQAELDQLRQQQDQVERDLAGRVDGLAILQKARQAGPDTLAQRINRATVHVEMVKYRRFDFQAKDIHKQWQPPRYAALLLGRAAPPDGPPDIRLLFLGEAAPIDRAVHAWRAAAESGTVDPAAERTLRERVWQPLAKDLPAGTRRLFLAPDGELALVPFEALRLADGRYLVEQFQISYLSSGRDLMPRPTLKEPLGPALVLTDPDYDALGDAPAPPPGALVVRADSKRSSDLEKRGLRFKRLPGFAREADAVVQAWHAARPSDQIDRLQGPDASEEKLAAAKRPRLLYLITHGFFLPDLELLPAERDRLLRDFELVSLGPSLPRMPGPEDPLLRSGLALAGANQWQKRTERGQSDGLLTAREVRNLDLWGTDLVVLSACETGLGQVSNQGEGVLGLRQAFQLAGARTVLASLWKVPDRDTERLMTKFFQRWLKGTPKAQALREAQLELLAELRKGADPQRRGAPPLYWAGFICHGLPE